MFGYILPEKAELKIKEYELFKAYYCGVCKSIGKRYGLISRMTLNYDSTFLAVLLTSLKGDPLSVKKERCIVHPIQKRSVIKDNKIIDYASDMNILLAYYKLEDNWKDEHSKLSIAGMMVLGAAFKKIKNKYPEKCSIIKEQLDTLAQLEKEKCDSVDQAAEPFAKLMEEVLYAKEFCKDGENAKAIRWIGYNIGKWLYTLDAYDDLQGDIKKKRYNPFIEQCKYNKDITALKSSIKERVEFNLTYTLSEIAKGYELLNVVYNKGLIENIIYMGMLRKTEQILEIGSCKKSEKSI